MILSFLMVGGYFYLFYYVNLLILLPPHSTTFYTFPQHPDYFDVIIGCYLSCCLLCERILVVL